MWKRGFTFWKGVVAVYLVFLVLFFAATPIFALLLYRETDFSRSVLPVLIGFCLQGIFLVVVLAIFDRQSQQQARQRNKMTLRTLLTTVVHWCLTAETPRSALEMRAEAMQLGEIIAQFRARGMAQEECVQLIQYARRELLLLEMLSSVAANIDPPHLHAWLAIIEQVRALGAEMAPCPDTVLVLLEKIQEFEELPV